MVLDVDGTGATEVDTGLPFFDHMVSQLGRHGGFDLTVVARGDLEVDAHHTVEDVGHHPGRGPGRGAGGQGRASGASARWPCPWTRRWSRWPSTSPAAPSWPTTSSSPRRPTRSGNPPFDPQLAEEFWRAFATAAGITLHIRLRIGQEHPPHRRGLVQGGGPGPAGRRPPRGRRHPLHQGHVVTGRRPVAPPSVIAVLDYGIGNLRSAEKALQHLGADAQLVDDPGPGRRGRRGGAARGGGVRPVRRGPPVQRTGPGRAVAPSSGACRSSGSASGSNSSTRGPRRTRPSPGLGILPGWSGAAARGQAPPDAVEPARAGGRDRAPACWPALPDRGLGLLRPLLRPRGQRRHLVHL